MNEPPYRDATAAAAKARLLDWADESDARARKSRSSIGTIAAGGGIALLAGLAVARVVSPRRRGDARSSLAGTVGKGLIGWALVARVGTWLLPHAISAMRSSTNRRRSQRESKSVLMALRNGQSPGYIGASP